MPDVHPRVRDRPAVGIDHLQRQRQRGAGPALGDIRPDQLRIEVVGPRGRLRGQQAGTARRDQPRFLGRRLRPGTVASVSGDSASNCSSVRRSARVMLPPHLLQPLHGRAAPVRRIASPTRARPASEPEPHRGAADRTHTVQRGEAGAPKVAQRPGTGHRRPVQQVEPGHSQQDVGMPGAVVAREQLRRTMSPPRSRASRHSSSRVATSARLMFSPCAPDRRHHVRGLGDQRRARTVEPRRRLRR